MNGLNVYNSVTTPQSARAQEALAFRLAARKLREATDRLSRNKALHLNHELWSIMLRDLGGSNNALPPILKKDCFALARFSVDYSTRAVLKPELPLDPLISVNEEVAAGLDQQSAAPSPTPAPASIMATRPAAIYASA